MRIMSLALVGVFAQETGALYERTCSRCYRKRPWTVTHCVCGNPEFIEFMIKPEALADNSRQRDD